MNTSYFAKSGKNSNAVSIAIRAPEYFSGKTYNKLAPPLWLLKKYKDDYDATYYIKHYKIEVLDHLDPKEVLKDLGEDAILLCWEKKGKFCHRHLVAKWFKEKLGIEVKEI